MTRDTKKPLKGATKPKVEPILQVGEFTKQFADVLANDAVSFEVLPGEVHALVGENGAGKSTLLKMIYGVYAPDSGWMMVGGKEATPGSPAEARALGIGMVFQDLRLVPALTVTENIALALDTGWWLRLDSLASQVRAASTQFGLGVDPKAKVQHLSIGERQKVEILKVLMTGARLVILDEPTSVLAPQEVESLLAVVRHLRDQGLGIVIVTHKLREVRAIADRVTVLRGGKVVLAHARPQDHSDSALVEAMVGKKVSPLKAERSRVNQDATPALELVDIRTRGDAGHEALKHVSVRVLPGELVGVAGVAGSGQRELCEVACGLRHASHGTVRVGGVAVKSPRDASRAGAVSVPEDPVADSVVARLNIVNHMALDGRPLPGAGLDVDWGTVRTNTEAANERLGLNIAPRHRRLAELSGGNIQRVILTREFGVADATLVVAAYPSRGLDAANVRRTQEILLDARHRGAGVLMVSEDLDELMALADRIVVMHDGHVSGVVAAEDFDRQALGALMLEGAEPAGSGAAEASVA